MAARDAAHDATVSAAHRRASTAGARGAEQLGLRVGDDVRHEKFGEGVIVDIEGSGDKAEAVVRFRDVGEKRLLLVWAPLALRRERVTSGTEVRTGRRHGGRRRARRGDRRGSTGDRVDVVDGLNAHGVLRERCGEIRGRSHSQRSNFSR